MTAPLQQFFLDLQSFAADLKNLLSGKHLRTALAGSWQSLRRDRQRQLPLLLTMTVHLVVLLLSLVGPRLLSNRIRIPEVYRVELYNAVELPSAPPTSTVKPAPVPAPTPVKVQVQPPPTPVPAPSAKPKAVSLAPVKQRLLKEQEERQSQERQSRLLANRLEELELARQQKEAEEIARQAASHAVGKLADLYRTAPATAPVISSTASGDSRTTTTTAAAPSPPGYGEPSPRQLEAQERYKARLFQHIKPNWQLPDLQNWDETLSATIVMRIKWDGTVDTTWLEKKSGDQRFDQYVKKAIDNSAPLPPLPVELNRQSEEIAVTFTPGGLR